MNEWHPNNIRHFKPFPRWNQKRHRRKRSKSLPFVKRLELRDLIRIFPGASATAQIQSQTCTQVGENWKTWVLPMNFSSYAYDWTPVDN